MANKYGVTPTGFVRKRLDTILKEYQTDISDRLGREIATQTESAFGILIGILAERDAEQWEEAEKIYYAMYPGSAEDINLDNAVQYAGVKRKRERQTRLDVTCYGVDQTKITIGSIIKDTQNNLYRLETHGFIDHGNASYAQISASLVTDHDFYISLDGKLYRYTATSGDSPDSIASSLAELINGDVWQAEPKGNFIIIQSQDHKGGHNIEISGNLSFVEVGSILRFKAEEYGSISPQTGTVREIVTRTTGWNKIANLIDPIEGRLEESNIQLRQSYLRRVSAQGSAMVEAIEGKLLEKVANIRIAKVYENDKDYIDADGLPAHSIEVVVDGGEVEEIANVIWQTRTGGIEMVGRVVVNILDSRGNSREIRFNRPSEKNVWLRICITKNPEEVFTADLPDRIRALVVTESANLNVGQDVVLQKLYGPIYKNTTGIGMVDIKGTLSENLPADDDYGSGILVIGKKEIAVFDSSRIEVMIID